MKRILVVLEEDEFDMINKVKTDNNHTWEEVLLAYAQAFKTNNDEKEGKWHND